MGVVQRMAEPKVRILADVNVETRDKLEEIVKARGITKKDFFEEVIEEKYKEITRGQ